MPRLTHHVTVMRMTNRRQKVKLHWYICVDQKSTTSRSENDCPSMHAQMNGQCKNIMPLALSIARAEAIGEVCRGGLAPQQTLDHG